MPPGDRLKTLIVKKTFHFGNEDRAAKGKALINVVSVKTGETRPPKLAYTVNPNDASIAFSATAMPMLFAIDKATEPADFKERATVP